MATYSLGIQSKRKKLKLWVNISTSYLERWILTIVKPSKLLITIQVLLIQLELTFPWILRRLSKRLIATCLEMNANMLKIIMIKHISYIHSKGLAVCHDCLFIIIIITYNNTCTVHTCIHTFFDIRGITMYV